MSDRNENREGTQNSDVEVTPGTPASAGQSAVGRVDTQTPPQTGEIPVNPGPAPDSEGAGDPRQ